jgi:hypothetical protein
MPNPSLYWVHEMRIREAFILIPLPRNNRTELISVLAILELSILLFRDGAHNAGRTNLRRLGIWITGHLGRVVSRIKSNDTNLGQTCF